MSDWLFDILGDTYTKALKEASRYLVYKELSNNFVEIDYDLIRRAAEVLELTVREIILNRYKDDEDQSKKLKKYAAEAFQLYRVLPLPDDPLPKALHLLQITSLAVIGDMGSAASRILSEVDWPDLPLNSSNWLERTWAVIIDVWLRLIRKQGWSDRDAVLENIDALRRAQEEFELKYLNSLDSTTAKIEALEFVGLYHLAKTAEIFSFYLTDGAVEGNYQVQQLLDTHFDRVFEVCKLAPMIHLEPLSQLLSVCAAQMVENSIWTVTRAVNSRVTQFVRNMVNRGRGQGAIFEMLPPQRRALADKGLLGSSRRAVVVSLPTSSGKTLIAQFRILQALNQFEYEQGWVAYLVPTRTLVNQITRQLRRDFLPLGIIVEQISPALEIDNIEMELLQEHDRKQAFRVLVTTPEKFDLMLRQGWEEKIERPLTLVVVDEAHNIQSPHRGLKLELLLSTINKECQRAQFLLLTPFIKNAKEIARWLGGTNSDDISLSLDWQPNDRVIGIVQPVKAKLIKNNSYDYKLSFNSIHTTRNTLVVDDLITLPKSEELASTYRKVCSTKIMAAVTAQFLHKRGPVIVMHARPDWVWSLANTLKIESNCSKVISNNILLVQKFLRLEFGSEFPLIELLAYKIGIHHAGLSDEVRALMEWLFEENELNFLVATTTIAQGVNFPVTGVVMASHQYPSDKGMIDMPSEDFWNIAGRAGRIGQESLGVIALVTESEAKAKNLKKFINNQTGDLNSALLNLAIESSNFLDDLEGIIYRTPEWSSFLQYLTHTYRQMGKPDTFVDLVEQVLRGTFGFEKLRVENPLVAKKLLSGIQSYAEYLKRPKQPLKLVDSTGFSLQSINMVLKNKGNIDASSWDPISLFQNKNTTLQDMMGILLRVPELRENFQVAIGGEHLDGNKLSLIIKDWVNGVSVFDITNRYFRKEGEDFTIAMTKCGQSLFGRLTQAASWGLGALLSITVNDLPEEQYKKLSNLPSRVYYGVNDDSAIALRLLGIPRSAANPLASSLSSVMTQPLSKIRNHLRNLSEKDWIDALGESGKTYRNIWHVLEGLPPSAQT